MSTLGDLFNSEDKIKIIRLFLFNPETVFDMRTISLRSKSGIKIAEKNIKNLLKCGLIRKKVYFVTVKKKIRKKFFEKKIKMRGFGLNNNFVYLSALNNLFIDMGIFDGQELIKKISKAGKLRLLLISGIFIKSPESRTDIFIVGDKMRRKSLDKIIKSIESGIGRELIYAYLDIEDYKYRLGMHDKLVRDVIDFPHKVLLDKISL